jgi:hypothetical protein
LLFKHKSTVKVDMADLDGEKSSLAEFLLSHFKLDSTVTSKGLEVNQDKAPTASIANMVTKFLYHKNLNSTHWVTLENNVVKISRFKSAKKKEKHGKSSPSQNITQSWGL